MFHKPISGLELAGELGPLLLVLSLQVADGERDALLTVGSQTATLRGGRGAGRGGQGAEGGVRCTVMTLTTMLC